MNIVRVFQVELQHACICMHMHVHVAQRRFILEVVRKHACMHACACIFGCSLELAIYMDLDLLCDRYINIDCDFDYMHRGTTSTPALLGAYELLHAMHSGVRARYMYCALDPKTNK